MDLTARGCASHGMSFSAETKYPQWSSK